MNKEIINHDSVVVFLDNIEIFIPFTKEALKNHYKGSCYCVPYNGQNILDSFYKIITSELGFYVIVDSKVINRCFLCFYYLKSDKFYFVEEICDDAQENKDDFEIRSGLSYFDLDSIFLRNSDLFHKMCNINCRSIEVQQNVVEFSPHKISSINNPTEELQILALENAWRKSFYEGFIKDLPNKTEWFYRELNRLKLIKGPLRD